MRLAAPAMIFSSKPKPPYAPRRWLLALRVGLIAAGEGWCPEYSRTTFHDWFINRHAPGVADHVERVLTSLEKPTAAIIARAKSHEAESLMKEVTDEARSLSIFGAPTCAIGREIFWGDDRLEDALQFALSQDPEPIADRALRSEIDMRVERDA
jgi:2-hydroxychromene-2-carboxylate isomerase